MADITLSAAVRNNLLSLQNTASLLSRTQERLATGLKVNSALDDPTAFFTASGLNSRASDLSRLLDSVGLAIQTLEEADNGIEAITALVESAQAAARQALQSQGQVTESIVAGAATAGFNPQALTSIVGTGATATTADASATIDSGAIGADANIAVASTDLGNSTTTLTSLGVADGDVLTIDYGGTAITVGFFDDGVGTGQTVVVDLDTGGPASGPLDVATFATALNAYTSGNSLGTVTDTAGVLTFTPPAATEYIQFTDTTGTNVAELGLGAVGYGTDATDRLVTRNATLDQLAFEGATLNVQLGGSSVGTVTFGTGANVSNLTELVAAIDAYTGVSASQSGGVLTVATTDTNDADSTIVLTGNSNSTLETVLGYTPDTVGGSVVTASPTNLLSAANGLTQGDTLTVKIGSQTTTITFGTSSGQVSTLRELNTTLNAITSGSASVATSGGSIGNISITTGNAADSIKISGSTGTAARFGLTEGEFSNLVNGTSGPVQENDTLTIQVGTNSALVLTFGTDANEINTITELQSELTNLAGGTATVDTTTGAITIEADTITDSITVTDSTPARSAAAFGLTAGTFASTTTDSTVRAALETDFNAFLDQVDQLARDASFNGNNLLQADDFKVIFNEDGSSSLTINGVDFDSGGLGINRVTAGTFQTDTNIDTVLAQIDTAITSLRTQASKFGANLSVVEVRNQFIKKTVNTLETGAGGLTLADTNEEGANLLALQTRQQLSTVALSLASQNDQSVLRLF